MGWHLVVSHFEVIITEGLRIRLPMISKQELRDPIIFDFITRLFYKKNIMLLFFQMSLPLLGVQQ